MLSRLKIRGIYSTALTKLVLEGGYSVVEPSAKIKHRLGLGDAKFEHDILIQDKDDFQGIVLYGEPDKITQFWTFLHERLVDAVMLGVDSFEDQETLVKAAIEFPGLSKQILDKVRSSVCPTLLSHHRFRIIDSRTLEQMENSFIEKPDKQDFWFHKFTQKKILLPLKKSGLVRLEHIRPSGRQMRPREGILLSADENHIAFKRFFSEGRYDGLDLPIEKGDYGITEIQGNAWFIKHTYFSRNGTVKGEYFNVNTPVEFYPYGARYVDLEVDVIRRAGEKAFLIDEEKLGILRHEGRIGKTLEKKALEIADILLSRLNS